MPLWDAEHKKESRGVTYDTTDVSPCMSLLSSPRVSVGLHDTISPFKLPLHIPQQRYERHSKGIDSFKKVKMRRVAIAQLSSLLPIASILDYCTLLPGYSR